MNKKNLRITLLILGILALIFSLVLFTLDTGYYESYEYYGGDAYTGIQHAAAQTANNVLDLTYIIQYGLAFILLIHSGVLIGISACIEIPSLKKCNEGAHPNTSDNINQFELAKEAQEVET